MMTADDDMIKECNQLDCVQLCMNRELDESKAGYENLQQALEQLTATENNKLKLNPRTLLSWNKW